MILNSKWFDDSPVKDREGEDHEGKSYETLNYHIGMNQHQFLNRIRGLNISVRLDGAGRPGARRFGGHAYGRYYQRDKG